MYLGWQTLAPIKGWKWWRGVLVVWAEPSPDCQLTGPDFPVLKSLVQWAKLGKRTAQGLEACKRIFQTDKHRLCSSVTSPPVWQSRPCHHRFWVMQRALLSLQKKWKCSDIRVPRGPNSRESTCKDSETGKEDTKYSIPKHLQAKHSKNQQQHPVKCSQNAALPFEA